MSKEISRLQKIAGLLKESEENQSLEMGDRVIVTYGSQFYGQKGTIRDVRSGFVIVKIDDTDGLHSMHMSDVEKIEDEDDEDGYDSMEENEINEAAYVPDNVAKFAKKKGVSALVNKVAGWAEKAGKGITGGTAIGKNYDTLILDIRHQDGAIYIDIPEGTVELYGEPVFDSKSFAKVLASQSSDDSISEIDTNDPILMKARAAAHQKSLPQQKPEKTVNANFKKSTRLNSSHITISYAVFCLNKKNQPHTPDTQHAQNT